MNFAANETANPQGGVEIVDKGSCQWKAACDNHDKILP